MTVVYSQTVINSRLQVVANAIDAGPGNGQLFLQSSGQTISTITLAKPCGTAAAGVLTFVSNVQDPSAAGSGNVSAAIFADSTGNTVISGLSVGIPLSSADVIINGPTTQILAGEAVQLVSARITGS